MTTIIPENQPINPPSLVALMDALKRNIMLGINCAKIGTIVSFDAGASGVRPATATVQIAQQQVTGIDNNGNKTYAAYPQLELVPVFFPCGGGFTLTFPVQAGDECLLLFSDRDIDNWYQNGAWQPPYSGRTHDMSDAIALVGLRSCPRALGGISTTSTQLRSDDGTTYVEVKAGQLVNVVAPAGCKITTPTLTVTGVLTVQNVAGDTIGSTVNGGFKTTGGDIIADTISLKEHIHSGVQSGGSNTGVPVP